jgi:hypothetical protein
MSPLVLVIAFQDGWGFTCKQCLAEWEKKKKEKRFLASWFISVQAFSRLLKAFGLGRKSGVLTMEGDGGEEDPHAWDGTWDRRRLWDEVGSVLLC